MKFFALKTPLFQIGENLFLFFQNVLKKQNQDLEERSIIIIASKLAALAQGRVVSGSKAEISAIMQSEAEKSWVTNLPEFFLTLKDGILIANAGADSSNAPEGKLILWPENPQQIADEFRDNLRREFGVQEIGVLITDSRCTPLRAGVSGVALAWSGFEGVTNEIGKKDLYGNPLEVTKNAVADNLASAAQLLIGNSAERTPFVICEDAPLRFTDEQQSPRMAQIRPEEDLFSVFWSDADKEN